MNYTLKQPQKESAALFASSGSCQSAIGYPAGIELLALCLVFGRRSGRILLRLIRFRVPKFASASFARANLAQMLETVNSGGVAI